MKKIEKKFQNNYFKKFLIEKFQKIFYESIFTI